MNAKKLDEKQVRIVGIGMQLPSREGVCDTKEQFWEIVKKGKCEISNIEEDNESKIKIAGKVHTIQSAIFGLAPKHEKKYSRASFLAAIAVRNALVDAKLDPRSLSNERTLLVVASAFFTLETLTKQHSTYLEEGNKGLGIDFLLQGTPGSIASAVSKLTSLDCPTLTVSGSCVVALNALEIANERIQSGKIDRAIVVGVDAPIDALYLSATSYRNKSGSTLSSLSSDPNSVRPHDKRVMGNACGEGAVAVILEGVKNEEKSTTSNLGPYKLYFSTSRKSGNSLVDSGEPDNYGKSVKRVLDKAVISMGDVGFINDFCEGTQYIEDFFCDIVRYIRKETKYSEEMLLTNQEAAFGHVPAAAGLIKLLSNTMMMEKQLVTPCINCEQVYDQLNYIQMVPVQGKCINKQSKYSLVISGGSGGDCAVMLIEKCN